uniref:Uncharacterized protein n=1 Tax=Arundo donax TaxID=35708 RepID=A0A0A9C5N8_ARUDO
MLGSRAQYAGSNLDLYPAGSDLGLCPSHNLIQVLIF